MKTNKEILAAVLITDVEYLDLSAHMRVSDALEAMKIYANQKLDLAVEELGNHPIYYTEAQGYENDRQSILNLKD